MAIKPAQRVASGDFLNFKELTKDGPVLCCFRIVEFLPPEQGDYGALKVPVLVDVLICDGERTGEVHLNENLFGAPTGPLRGVPNPGKGEQPLDPINEVGDVIAARVEYIERKGTASFIALNEPSATELKVMGSVENDGAGWVAASGNGAKPKSGRPWA